MSLQNSTNNAASLPAGPPSPSDVPTCNPSSSPPAPAPLEGWEKHKSDLRMVFNYLKRRFKAGFAIGVVGMVLCTIDRSGVFVHFLFDTMTTIPVTVVLACSIGALIPILDELNPGTLANACDTWFDLLQQFFTLSVGVFWPIQGGMLLRSICWDVPYHFDSVRTPLSFLALSLGAVLSGGAWALRHEKCHSITKKLVVMCIVALAIMLLWSLVRSDGGEFLREAFLQMGTGWLGTSKH